MCALKSSRFWLLFGTVWALSGLLPLLPIRDAAARVMLIQPLAAYFIPLHYLARILPHVAGSFAGAWLLYQCFWIPTTID